MSTQIPEDAKLNDDLDCVLLTNWPSYFSQLVRLTAAEKGCRYKHKLVDHTIPMQHIEPWYLKLNNNGYVPTMLVHPD